MKVVAIVQARLGSIRLPDKVLKIVVGRPLIDFLLDRLSEAEEVDQVIVAIPCNERHKPLAEHLRLRGVQAKRKNFNQRWFHQLFVLGRHPC